MTRLTLSPGTRLLALGAATLFAVSLSGQAAETLVPDAPLVSSPAPPGNTRVLGLFPNYRTVPMPAVYKPITSREKFDLAIETSFDRSTIVFAAALAGEGQFTKSNPSFGNGIGAYGRYFGTAYADLVIGDFMTEAIYPTLLHQDPRYFRLGTGSGFSRLEYATERIFWTRTDSGGGQFNYSELAGNATAVAISTAYYPDGRSVGSAASKFGLQIGIDLASNILKEFWPDMRKKLSREGKTADSAQSWTVERP